MRAQSCPKNVNFDTFLSVANPLLRAVKMVKIMNQKALK